MSFGAWLAARGPLAIGGLGLTALIGVGAAAAALVSSPARAALLPDLASTAVAWGGGMSLAVGAALGALRHDRAQGLLALARARGASTGEAVGGRVAGLVVLLVLAVGGSTLLAVAGAVVRASGAGAVLGASVGAVAYAVAFALTMGPVALATLGARTRAGGYLTLVAVLTLPELLAPWTAHLLPRGWTELTSIPEALAAVRAGVAHPAWAGAHGVRGAAGLVAVAALATLVVAARVARGGDDADPAR